MGTVAIVVAVVFTLVGLGIMGYAVLERRWLRAFACRAVTTGATVERVTVTTPTGSDHRPGRVHLRYRAVVSFKLPDGTVRQARTRWPTSVRPVVGAVVPVRYDPQRPRRVVPAAGAGSQAPATGWYVAIGAVAIVIGWIGSSVLRTFS